MDFRIGGGFCRFGVEYFVPSGWRLVVVARSISVPASPPRGCIAEGLRIGAGLWRCGLCSSCARYGLGSIRHLCASPSRGYIAAGIGSPVFVALWSDGHEGRHRQQDLAVARSMVGDVGAVGVCRCPKEILLFRVSTILISVHGIVVNLEICEADVGAAWDWGKRYWDPLVGRQRAWCIVVMDIFDGTRGFDRDFEGAAVAGMVDLRLCSKGALLFVDRSVANGLHDLVVDLHRCSGGLSTKVDGARGFDGDSEGAAVAGVVDLRLCSKGALLFVDRSVANGLHDLVVAVGGCGTVVHAGAVVGNHDLVDAFRICESAADTRTVALRRCSGGLSAKVDGTRGFGWDSGDAADARTLDLRRCPGGSVVDGTQG